jgi:tetratricopeptide (TPR) repeat protein
MDSISAADIHLEYAPHLFVDRSEAIEKVHLIVADLAAGRPIDTRAIAFVSESGTGKSWLLRHLAETAITPDNQSLALGHQLSDEGAHSLYVNLSSWDVRPENKEVLNARVRTLLIEISHQVARWMDVVPTGTLGAGEQAPLDDLSRWLEADVRQYAEKSVLVLMLDQVYESSWSLLNLLDRYLLGPLAAIRRVLIVLAGRGRGYPWKSPELRLHTERIELKPFNPEQTREQIGKQVPDKIADATMIWELSGGYPGSNYAIARLGPDAGLEAIVQRLLASAPQERRDQVREHLEALCVLPSFDDDRILPLLATYYNDSSYEKQLYPQAVAVRKELVEHAFATWDDAAGGWVLDDAVRIAVENCMRGRREKSELFARLQGRAYELFQEWRKQYPDAAKLWGEEADRQLVAAYSCVRMTSELIGREAQLSEIDSAIDDLSHSYIIQIIGVGGIGKTRLVSEVLRRHWGTPGLCAAPEPVDLYHGSTHSDEGLMAAIERAIAPAGEEFAAYHAALGQLNAYLAEPRGDIAEQRRLRQNVEDAFLSDLNRLSKASRLVLVLDTAENLVYEDTDVERELDLTHERIGGWDWLKRFLPQVQNAVVIVAGRPQTEQLATDFKTMSGVCYKRVDLAPFTDEEAAVYFNAVTMTAAQLGHRAAVHRLRALPETARNLIIRKSGGRPIILGLAIDYLVIADRLPPVAELERQERFEQELVRTILETGRPADKALRTLAWMRKGADAELLARAADLKTADGSWDLDQASQLTNRLKGLSFVKIRPDDQRMFLHDEMYNLLERHVSSIAQTGRVYGALLNCYRLRIQQTRDSLRSAYQALRTGDETAVQHIMEITKRLHEAMVESLHYQLRAKSDTGFEAYYRYAEEAVLGEIRSLDAQLRVELLEFLNLFASQASCSLCEMVNTDAAIRWVKRHVADERYVEAQQLATHVRTSKFLSASDQLAQADLTIWEALAQLYSGSTDLAVVRRTLVETVNTLERLPRTWRREAVLARAYNNLGYFYRISGSYKEAIAAYHSAVPRWRAVNIPAEQANTLNNLAFARHEMGDFGTARRQALDALELRLTIGARPQIGLSYNTLAQISIDEGFFITAEEYARKALQLFEAVRDERGIGLALIALAEALRRDSTQRPHSLLGQDTLLQQAVEFADRACQIFAGLSGEPSRQIEALIELGCGYRDWAKLRRDYQPLVATRESVEGFAHLSEHALEQAEGLAEEKHIAYQTVNARVNRAWLHYYLLVHYDQRHDIERAKQQRNQLMNCLRDVAPDIEEWGDWRPSLVPREYYYVALDSTPPDKRSLSDLSTIPFLAQLGKAELLWGQLAFYLHDSDQTEELLRKAVRHYALALAYDDIKGSERFRDKQRAKDRIYNRLKTLNSAEWQIVYDEVSRVERVYGLGENSAMRRFLKEDFGEQTELKPFGL